MAVQGSHHQGHPNYTGSGKQCLANAIASIQHMESISLPSTWGRKSIDEILAKGDKLYNETTSSNPLLLYLSIDDIPQHVGKFSKSFHGTIHGDTEPPFYDLKDGITNAFGKNETVGCVFTMGHKLPSYSAAILKEDQKFYFFDPHSRNDCGMGIADGNATLTYHKNIEQLSLFIQHLAASLKLCGVIPYEIACFKSETFSNVCSSISFIDSESEFSGFEEISEGEYTCRLYLAESVEMSDISVSDISDVSDIETSDTESDRSTAEFDVYLMSDHNYHNTHHNSPTENVCNICSSEKLANVSEQGSQTTKHKSACEQISNISSPEMMSSVTENNSQNTENKTASEQISIICSPEMMSSVTENSFTENELFSLSMYRNNHDKSFSEDGGNICSLEKKSSVPEHIAETLFLLVNLKVRSVYQKTYLFYLSIARRTQHIIFLMMIMMVAVSVH